jgi:hypothetical protein
MHDGGVADVDVRVDQSAAVPRRPYGGCGLRLPARPWRAVAARAHLELGNRDEAMRLALDDLTLARKGNAAVTIGRAPHTMGHVSGGAEAVPWLSDAAATPAGTGARQLRAACLPDLAAARLRQGQAEAAGADLRMALLDRLDQLPGEETQRDGIIDDSIPRCRG